MATDTKESQAVRAWCIELKAALLRLEAAVYMVEIGRDAPETVQVELARVREVWDRCPLPLHEMGAMKVHVLANGTWETHDVS